MSGAPSRAAAFVVALVACSGAGGGGAPERVPPAGLVASDAPAACAAGSGADPLGACVPAGVPPSSCAPGFVADGASGCAPILPPNVCPDGTYARPGEAACVEIAPCGDATFPTVADESTTRFVAATADVDLADGTRAHPFRSVAAAVASAPPGGTVAVAAGAYTESFWIDRPLTLLGRCPRLTRLVLPPGGAALWIVRADDVDGLVLDGLTLDTGAGESDADAMDVFGGVTALRRFSFVGQSGVSFNGGAYTVEDALFIHGANALRGAGSDGSVRSSVFVGRPLGKSATPTAITVAGGSMGSSERAPRVTIAQSVVDGVEQALDVVSAEVVIDATVIRHGAPRAPSPAIYAESASVDVARSVFSSLGYIGIVASASWLSVDRSTFRDLGYAAVSTLYNGQSLADPDALAATEIPPSTVVRATSIARATLCGIAVSDAPLMLGRVAIDDTRGDDAAGLCVGSLRPIWSPAIVVGGSRIHGAVTGISAVDATLTVYETDIADMHPNAAGAYGDGIDVVGSYVASSIALDASSIARAARAGVGIFGATLDLRGTTFRDCAIDLDGEPNIRRPAVFHDLGGDVCLDAAGSHPCAAGTVGLAPPAPR